MNTFMNYDFLLVEENILSQHNLIDFDRIKPVENSFLLLDDENLKFLYDSDFLPLDMPSPTLSFNSSVYSPASTIQSLSPMEEKCDSWFEPLATTQSITTNTTDKKHVCAHCSRSFSRKHDLQRHSRVHTGLKPYNCPCCAKSFARSDARGRHFHTDPTCSNSIQVQTLLRQKKERTSSKKPY